jgi:hypothetical protein
VESFSLGGVERPPSGKRELVIAVDEFERILPFVFAPEPIAKRIDGFTTVSN